MNHRIYWHKRLNKWMVNIRYNGENIHVGYFIDKSNAIIARNKALFELYGSVGLKESHGKSPFVNKKIKRKKKTRLEVLLDETKQRKDAVDELTEKLAKQVKEIDHLLDAETDR